MVNISAGGFAFRCPEPEFADCVGAVVELKIAGEGPLNKKALSGVIMRCTDNKGTYIVGGRFLEDDADIMNYVNTYIRE